MDLIALAMAKAYADKQSKAYIKRTEEVLLPETTEKFVEALGFPGAYMLEPLDIADGDTLSVIWDGVQYNCTVAREDDLLMFGNQNIINDTENTGEPFAYTTINGEGLFVSVNEGTHTFSVIKYTEIIDPKYLQSAVLDLDEFGLTPYILELANKGGGSKRLSEYDVDIIKTIYDKFPTGHDYAAKITVSASNAMYVTPVYTTFNKNGFALAHFDSYLVTNQGDTMNKFFVRISRYITENFTENLKERTIDINVGFYA